MDFFVMTVNVRTFPVRQLSHGAIFPSLLSRAGGDAISLWKSNFHLLEPVSGGSPPWKDRVMDGLTIGCTACRSEF
jgi:hypothetical protein